MAKLNKKIDIKKYSGKWYSSIYFILSIAFIVWMLFFDSNSYLTHQELNQEISKLKREKIYYKSKLDSENAQYKNLKYNKSEREKYARENYFFKKNNEDIFIIVSKDDTVKTNQKNGK